MLNRPSVQVCRQAAFRRNTGSIRAPKGHTVIKLDGFVGGRTGLVLTCLFAKPEVKVIGKRLDVRVFLVRLDEAAVSVRLSGSSVTVD